MAASFHSQCQAKSGSLPCAAPARSAVAVAVTGPRDPPNRAPFAVSSGVAHRAVLPARCCHTKSVDVWSRDHTPGRQTDQPVVIPPTSGPWPQARLAILTPTKEEETHATSDLPLAATVLFASFDAPFRPCALEPAHPPRTSIPRSCVDRRCRIPRCSCCSTCCSTCRSTCCSTCRPPVTTIRIKSSSIVTSRKPLSMAARGPAGGPRGLNNRFAQFKLVLLGMKPALRPRSSRLVPHRHMFTMLSLT